MKIIGIRDAQKRFSGLVLQAQKEPVVITRHGRPEAVLRGVGKRRAEDVFVEESSKFWQEIEKARNTPGQSMTQEEVEEHFNIKPVRPRKQKR